MQAHEVAQARAHAVDAGAAALRGVAGQRAVQVEQQDGPRVRLTVPRGRLHVQEPLLVRPALLLLAELLAGEGNCVAELLLVLLLTCMVIASMFTLRT